MYQDESLTENDKKILKSAFNAVADANANKNVNLVRSKFDVKKRLSDLGDKFNERLRKRLGYTKFEWKRLVNKAMGSIRVDEKKIVSTIEEQYKLLKNNFLEYLENNKVDFSNESSISDMYSFINKDKDKYTDGIRNFTTDNFQEHVESGGSTFYKSSYLLQDITE
ncbi:MAG: hypothetical protein ACK5LT_02615 [Lachnospirales bacterium]